MASRTDTARPAARKGQATKQTKTIAKKTAASSTSSSKAVAKPLSRRLEPIVQTVDRNAPKPTVDLPKVRGELPVPVATFYF
jgi:hypothetical protein